MKKILFTFLFCFLSVVGWAQQTYFTPAIPPGSTGFSPTFRFKAGITDSLVNFYLANGNKSYTFLTARQVYAWVAAHGGAPDSSIFATKGFTHQNYLPYSGAIKNFITDFNITINDSLLASWGRIVHLRIGATDLIWENPNNQTTGLNAQWDGVVMNSSDAGHEFAVLPLDSLKNYILGGGGSLFYQHVQTNGTSRTQRANLNFLPEFTVTDNSPGTDISINTIAQSKITHLSDTLASVLHRADTTTLVQSKPDLKPTVLAFTNPLYVPYSGVNSNKLAMQHDHSIHTMGDSFTAAGLYQTQLTSLIGSSFTTYNEGIGGNSTTVMLGRFAAVTNANPEYIIILGGVNDLIGGLSATAIESNLQAMYTAASNNGIIVISMTVPPYGAYSGWTSAQETQRLALNTWILSTAINTTYKIDIATALWDPSNHTNLNPTYANVDGLHPNSAGYIVIGNTIYAGSTFTANSNIPVVYTQNQSVYFNQNLRTFDSPIFNNLSATTIVGVAGGTFTDDLTVYRSYSPTVGIIFFNQAKTQFIYTDGSNFNVIGAPLVVPSLVSSGDINGGGIGAFSGQVEGQNLVVTGTAGNGIIQLPTQSSTPTTPASGVNAVYTNAAGQFSVLGSNGFAMAFSRTSLTANRVYTLPDATTTLDGIDNTAILTNKTVDGVTPTTFGYIDPTSSIQTQINTKAAISSPTFTGVVTMPTPFTLGSTSVTSTGTQLNYLNAATGTTGTTSTNLVYNTSPTLVTPNLGTPSTLVGTNISGTAASLTAGNVTTNANLTGPVTSTGNATAIGSGQITNTMLAGSIDLTTKVTGLLPVANGGTGTASPGIVAGTNITVTGTWPNQTVNSSGGFTDPTTTNGDIIERLSGVPARLAIGVDSSFLHVSPSTHLLEYIKPIQYFNGTDFSGGASSASDTLTIKFSGIQRMFAGRAGILYSTGAITLDTAGIAMSKARATANFANLTQLGLKANIASPTFTGTPAAPTPGSNVNTTQIPTTAWTNTFYAAKASPTFTGTVTLPITSFGLASKIGIVEGTGGRTGVTTLVAGTVAITITGLTTSSRAFIQRTTSSGTTLTIEYNAVCTSNTLTITADIAAGTINTADTSSLNYVIFN